jgi:hypothetical protein
MGALLNLVRARRQELDQEIALDDDDLDGWLERLLESLQQMQKELDQPRPVVPGVEYSTAEEVEEFAADLDDLVFGIQALISHEEDLAAGIEYRCAVPEMVRAQHSEPKPPPAAKPSPASPRPQRRRSEPMPAPPQQDGWCSGVIRFFSAITRTGIVVMNVGEGSTEMTISAPVFEKSGLTTLVPNQRVKIRLVPHLDGRKEIDALELISSWNEQAAAVAEPASARRSGAIPANPQLATLERQRAMRDQFPGW